MASCFSSSARDEDGVDLFLVFRMTYKAIDSSGAQSISCHFSCCIVLAALGVFDGERIRIGQLKSMNINMLNRLNGACVICWSLILRVLFMLCVLGIGATGDPFDGSS